MSEKSEQPTRLRTKIQRIGVVDLTAQKSASSQRRSGQKANQDWRHHLLGKALVLQALLKSQQEPQLPCKKIVFIVGVVSLYNPQLCYSTLPIPLQRRSQVLISGSGAV
jgi:hypothetical protein